VIEKGFTLIELLIVVAIIAILAAIAIPNFLQAQTRAKVSRSQSDMRSIATGLESYFVDWNQYPPDNTAYQLHDLVQYHHYLPRLVHLTTPTAYLSGVPSDPLAQPNQTSERFRRPYTRVDSDELEPILAYDFAHKHRDEQAQYEFIASHSLQQPGAGAQLQWLLRGSGPDGRSAYLGSEECIVYDPTNGTTSQGEIIRSNLSQH